MKRWVLAALIVGAGAYGVWELLPRQSCAGVNRAQALDMALAAKRGMLSRSVIDRQRTFESDATSDIRLREGGYAAIVTFPGRGAKHLEALIEDDCYVGWSGD